MKIVNWQPLFTDHQLFTWRALQSIVTEPITHVIGLAASAVRTSQGWKGADLTGLEVVYLEGPGWWGRGRAIINANCEAVHVFGGYWAVRGYFPLIIYALWRGCNVAILQEAYSNQSVGYLSDGSPLVNSVKTRMRPLLYRAATALMKVMSRKMSPAFFLISSRAAEQFKRAGVREKQVFPFGYFVPSASVGVSQRECGGGSVRLVFVGSLLLTKGLDVAVAAVDACQREGIPVTLDVYGPGEPLKFITPSTHGVTYLGTIPFGQAQATIGRYDVLILPSRHDGWGVVVNEALLQGVPVITSENVGARCLVEFNGAGAVFRNEDVDGLKNVLRRAASSPGILSTWSANAAKVKPLIQPEVAAKYMYDVIMYYFFNVGVKPRLQCFELHLGNIS